MTDLHTLDRKHTLHQWFKQLASKETALVLLHGHRPFTCPAPAL